MPPNALKADGSLDYEALGVTPPSQVTHGTDDEVRSHLTPPTVIRWYQRGNELVAVTDLGEFVNYLPTDHLLQGVDQNNLPILKKLDL